jgi:predicted Asp-tRNA(Asn)/Glu-tRNA(Gln) amidotransferase subunit C
MVEEIEREAEKVLRELSQVLGEVDLEETYYVVEEINVTRNDENPDLDNEFIEISKKNAPRVDEEGYFITEVGRWVE